MWRAKYQSLLTEKKSWTFLNWNCFNDYRLMHVYVLPGCYCVGVFYVGGIRSARRRPTCPSRRLQYPVDHGIRTRFAVVISECSVHCATWTPRKAKWTLVFLPLLPVRHFITDNESCVWPRSTLASSKCFKHFSRVQFFVSNSIDDLLSKTLASLTVCVSLYRVLVYILAMFFQKMKF